MVEEIEKLEKCAKDPTKINEVLARQEEEEKQKDEESGQALQSSDQMLAGLRNRNKQFNKNVEKDAEKV